jgi:hypothetical protein
MPELLHYPKSHITRAPRKVNNGRAPHGTERFNQLVLPQPVHPSAHRVVHHIVALCHLPGYVILGLPKTSPSKLRSISLRSILVARDALMTCGACNVDTGEARGSVNLGRAGVTLLNTSPTSLTFSLSSTVLNPKCVFLPLESSDNQRAGTLCVVGKQHSQIPLLELFALVPLPLPSVDVSPLLATRGRPTICFNKC